MNDKKILVIDNKKTSLFLTKKLGKAESSKLEKLNISDLESLLQDNSYNYRIFGLGDDVFSTIRYLIKDDKIHLGLRTKIITNDVLNNLPIIQFNNIELFATNNTEYYDETFDNFTNLDFVPIDADAGRETTICYLTTDYDRSLLFQFDENDVIGLDFETNGFPTDENFYILGVGIGNREKGVYFATERPYEEIKDHPFFKDFYEFMKRNRNNVWVYYCPFEMACFYRLWQETFEVKDAMALVIMSGRRGSLKKIGRSVLNVKSWDDELDAVMTVLNKKIFPKYSNGKKFLSLFKDSKYYVPLSELEIQKKEKARLALLKKMSRKKEKKKLKELEEKENEKDSYSEKNLRNKPFPHIFDSIISSPSPNEYWEDRVIRCWGNSWACCPDSLMGEYCIKDVFVTVDLVDFIEKEMIDILGEDKYKECLIVHLFNMYLKVESDLTGQLKVNWDLVKKVEDYYKKIEYNSQLLLTSMLYEYHIDYFKHLEPVMDSFSISRPLLNFLYYTGSEFFLDYESQTRLVNHFLKDLISYNKENYQELLKECFKSSNDFTFLTLSKPFIDSYIENKKLNKKDIETFYRLLISFFNIENTIKSIIDHFILKNKEFLLKRNKYIADEIWKGQLGRSSENTLIDFIKVGVYSNKKIKDEYLKIITNYFLDDNLVKYRLKNSFIPHGYVKHVIYYNVVKIHKKNIREVFKNLKMDSEINNSLDRYLIYKFTSTPYMNQYSLWLDKHFRELLHKGMVFLKCYKDQPDCKDKGFVPELTDYETFFEFCKHYDKEMDQADKSSYNYTYGNKKDDWRITTIYKFITDKGNLIDFCRCFFDKKMYTISKDSSLYIPDEPINDLFFLEYFDKIFRLYKFANKELSSGIKFINTKSKRVIPFGRQFLLGDNSNTEGYAIPKITPLSTKTGRFTSNVHTIGGGDDSKLLFTSENAQLMYSYFDISQAEPRLFSKLSGDPELIALYSKGGDAYIDMAITAYPHLANPEFSAELKQKRQMFKAVFLAYMYGASPEKIAEMTGLSIGDVKEIIRALNERFSVAVKYSNDMVDYVINHNKRKTVFGDISRLEGKENAKTSALNHVIQGATTKIIALAFYNICREARNLNINLKFKYSVHDSCVNEFAVKDLFMVTMLYRKAFRQFVKNSFDVDFVYDLDLLPRNLRDHVHYKYNYENGLFELGGFSHHVDKILTGLNDEYEIIKCNEKEHKSKDQLLLYTSDRQPRDHMLFPVNSLVPDGKLMKKNVLCKLKNPLRFNFVDDSILIYDDKINI